MARLLGAGTLRLAAARPKKNNDKARALSSYVDAIAAALKAKAESVERDSRPALAPRDDHDPGEAGQTQSERRGKGDCEDV